MNLSRSHMCVRTEAINTFICDSSIACVVLLFSSYMKAMQVWLIFGICFGVDVESNDMLQSHFECAKS